MNLSYNIKYLKGDDIIKLEKYLHDVTYHDLKQEMFFKFTNNRDSIVINDKDGRSVTMQLQDFIDQTWTKLNIFFKFKDFTSDDVCKVNKKELEEFNKLATTIPK